MANKDSAHAHLYELLKDFDTGMLVTHSDDRGGHARPMAVAELRPDVDAYFVTAIDSPKVAEIEENHNVTLTFQSPHQFATLSGRMSVVRDQALLDRLWKEPWKVWFPRGKSDPSLALLKLDPDYGEYWDNTGVQGLKYAFRAAKAYAAGTTPATDREQSAKVPL
jgi:general stress protein 26